MIFDLRKAEIYKAVILYKLFPASILKFYRVLLFTLGLVPPVIWIINRAFPTGVNVSLGWSYIALPFAFSALFFEWFGNYYLKYPKIKSTDNIADLMEFEAAKVFDRSFEFSRSLGEDELSTKSLLTACLRRQVA